MFDNMIGHKYLMPLLPEQVLQKPIPPQENLIAQILSKDILFI